MHITLHLSNDVDCICGKKAGWCFASVVNCLDVSIEECEVYIKKSKEILFTITNNNKYRQKTTVTTITRKQKWKEDQMYGCFKWQTDKMANDKTWAFLRKKNLKRQTKYLLISAQKNTIGTNNVKAKMDHMKKIICRGDETINYIKEYNKLVQSELGNKNDWGGKIICLESCKRLNFDRIYKWYMHKEEYVRENKTQEIFWSFE